MSEVCLEEVVERMRRSGMSAREISSEMGVDPAWVEDLFSMWDHPAQQDTEPDDGV
ncbi:MAG: hypothetical protein M3397_08960 [Actinomycetota bacterium]|jgi:hypothetical protein|nr:hypothetical protein [Actinomycetota bacterium]